MTTYTVAPYTVDLDDATQYATIWEADAVLGKTYERPVATLQRARHDEDGPRWKLYTPDGRCVGTRRTTGASYDRLFKWALGRLIFDRQCHS